MLRRGFSVAACGALALLLTAAEAAPAQVAFFPLGRGTGAVFGSRGGIFYPGGIGYPGYGPSYYPSVYGGYGGYSPYYSQPYFSSYSTVYTTEPMYYGAASLPGYSPGYSTARVVSPPAGVGLGATNGVGEAAYSTSNYPVQSPDYTTRYPVAVSAALTASLTDKGTDSARVEVHVPDNAELWFDGQKTSQEGTDRVFRSPALEAGQKYVYDVRARWTQDGKPFDQTRQVTVRAGDHVVVDFPR